MNTLVINIPAQACAPTPQSLLTRSCVYTRLGKQNALELQGTATLGELGASIKSAKQVMLLLAAVDVTLLRMNVPPLSASKLRAALPNLVEERILADASDCVISSSNQPGGMQTVAVAQRAWVELLLQTLRGLGAQRIFILPSQTSLPLLEGQISGALQDMGSTLNLRMVKDDLGFQYVAARQTLTSVAGLELLTTLIRRLDLIRAIRNEVRVRRSTTASGKRNI